MDFSLWGDHFRWLHKFALSFLLESSFVAIVGTVSGTILARNVLTVSKKTVSIGQNVSLLTTILPAVQASLIYPAEARRYE